MSNRQQQQQQHLQMQQHHHQQGLLQGVSSSQEYYVEAERPKPKNAVTALAFFTRAKKESFRRDHPNEKINNPEFTKQCSAEWKAMSEEDKAPYMTLASEDLERYETEMAEYDPTFIVGGSNKRKRSPKEKDPNLPKRPITAFFIFSAGKRQELRDANPEWKYTEIASELGRMWNSLTEEEKQPFRDQGAAIKKEYNVKMTEYKQRKSLEMEQLEGTRST